MLSQVFAAVGLIVCVALALHMLLGARRQHALAQWWRGYQIRFSVWLRHWAPEARAERRRRQRLSLASQRQEALERARTHPPPRDEVEWDGNVAKPKFGQRNRTLH